MPDDFTWPLVPDPAPGAPEADLPAALEPATDPLAFLGRGLLRPFRRDEKNDLANGGGLALLTARVGQVLGTKADSTAGPGELAWRSDFGSRLHLLRHKNGSDALASLARAMVVEALRRWEPGVVVTSVTSSVVGKEVTLRTRFRLAAAEGEAVTRLGAVS